MKTMKKRVVGKPVLAEFYKTKFLPEDLTCEFENEWKIIGTEKTGLSLLPAEQTQERESEKEQWESGKCEVGESV